MLISKIILILVFIWRMYNYVKNDEKLEEVMERTSAVFATATIFIATVILYYFAGIFNLIQE